MENWKKTFAVIWSGQLASILSSSVVAFAIIFWVSLETGSAQVLALAAIAGMLPQSLLGPLVGVYVDRWDRKWTMILADSFIALCTLLLAVLFWLDVARMWHIYVLLACRSIGSAFHTPAMQASVPLLAPKQQLTRIAGINQIISSLSNIIGPAFGALLINLTGIGNILLLDVAGAFIACTTLLLVRIPNPERSTAQKPSLWREFREGFGAMHAVPGMGWFFTLAVLVWFFIMPVGVMFPLMTLHHFGGGAYEMSLIEIVWGGGALIGGAVMGARTYRVNQRADKPDVPDHRTAVRRFGHAAAHGIRALRRPFPDRRRHEQRLQLVVRLRHPKPHRRGSAGARHVAVLQFRTAPLGDRTARHGLPRRACRPDDDLRHRRHGHLLHRTRRILHPFGHAARPTIFLTTEIQSDKKRARPTSPALFHSDKIS